MTAYLFIGGESDGKHFRTDGIPRYEIGMSSNSREVAETPDSTLPHFITSQYQTYTIRRWVAGENTFAFYVLENMSDASAFLRLLQYYKKE